MEEFLRTQKRYAHLFSPERTDVFVRIQARADRNIRLLDTEER